MNFATVALVGLTLGQPATASQPLGSDYIPMNTRSFAIPIEYKPGKDRKQIRHVLLNVAHRGENVWYQEGSVTPDKDAFTYHAKEDGIYWFKYVVVDLQGNKDVVELTAGQPDLKMVIDTVQPQVRVTNAKRIGDDIVVEWQVEDKYPDESKTQVHFRPTDNPKGQWQEVSLPANSRTGVKFPCSYNGGTYSGGITVKITAVDIAGNNTEVTRDLPGNGVPQQTISNSPPNISPPNIPTVPVPAPNENTVKPPPVTPPIFEPLAPKPDNTIPINPAPIEPKPPVPKPSIQPQPPVQPQPPIQMQPVQMQPTPYVPEQLYTPGNNTTSGANQNDMKLLPTKDPNSTTAPTPAATPGNTNPAAFVGNEPTVEVSRAQAINYPRFDLNYDVEQSGPSGISRVDLWVTRDEGKTWKKWSQHDGKGGAVRVMLDVQQNTQLEGNYGFRLVPVSGAGFSESEPTPGTAPEMRVILDATKPQVTLGRPKPDPNAPDTLVLSWLATDRNFGEDPITLEWSASANGPWKPVAAAENEPVVQAGANNAPPVAKRLANTGQYAWRVPTGIPPHVYLKITARDAAGNVTERVATEAIPVDLSKPKAKISGIAPVGQPSRP